MSVGPQIIIVANPEGKMEAKISSEISEFRHRAGIRNSYRPSAYEYLKVPYRYPHLRGSVPGSAGQSIHLAMILHASYCTDLPGPTPDAVIGKDRYQVDINLCISQRLATVASVYLRCSSYHLELFRVNT